MLRGVEGGLEGSRTKTRAHRKKQATTISGREMALRPPAAGARRPSSVGKGRWSHKGPLPNQFGGEVVRQGEKKVPAVVPTAPRHAAVRHSGRFFSLLSPICGTRSTLCVNSVRRPRLQGPGDTGQEGKPPSPQPFVWCYRATAWGGGIRKWRGGEEPGPSCRYAGRRSERVGGMFLFACASLSVPFSWSGSRRRGW